jgi:hypothetical protein
MQARDARDVVGDRLAKLKTGLERGG